MGNYHKAIEGYKKATETNPYYIKAHSALGQVFIILGDKESALKEYDILMELDPVSAENLLRVINSKNRQ